MLVDHELAVGPVNRVVQNGAVPADLGTGFDSEVRGIAADMAPGSAPRLWQRTGSCVVEPRQMYQPLSSAPHLSLAPLRKSGLPSESVGSAST